MIKVLLVTVPSPILKTLSCCTRMIGCCALRPPSLPPVKFGSTKWTNSWMTKSAPIAVIRKTRDGAFRFRRGRYATRSNPTAAPPLTGVAATVRDAQEEDRR